MNRPIRVMIVGDHYLFRQCLASALAEQEQFVVVAAAAHGPSVLEEARGTQPDILLIDMDRPGRAALELTRQIAGDLPGVNVVLLGLNEVATEVTACIEAGAKGYVPKDASLRDLQAVMAKVLRGEAVCSPQIAHAMFARLSALARQCRWNREAADNLSQRELEVLRLIAAGLSNKQIALQLKLSLHTVKNHVHHILEKLQVEYRAEAVEFAYQRGWLQRQA